MDSRAENRPGTARGIAALVLFLFLPLAGLGCGGHEGLGTEGGEDEGAAATGRDTAVLDGLRARADDLARRADAQKPLRTFYVSPTGNDANTGLSDAQAWRTMQKAAETVRAGDTVLVRRGTYAGWRHWGGNSGTADRRITYKADPGVVIEGTVNGEGDGIRLNGVPAGYKAAGAPAQRCDYVTIDGFTVRNQARTGLCANYASFLIVRNCTFENNEWHGLLLGHCDDVLVEDNVAAHCKQSHGFYCANSARRPTFRRNVSHDNARNGIHLNGDQYSKPGDGIISGAVLERNVLYANNLQKGGSAISCDGVQDSLLENNLVYDEHDGDGITLYQIDGGGPPKGNWVLNNTVRTGPDSRWCLAIKDGGVDCTVRNNIFYNGGPKRGSLRVSADSLPGLQSDYNVVMDRMSPDNGDTILSLARWRALTRPHQDAHSRVATPEQLFADPGKHDYHLAATSPARGAGTGSGAPKVDLDGRPRPGSKGWDAGACQFAD